VYRFCRIGRAKPRNQPGSSLTPTTNPTDRVFTQPGQKAGPRTGKILADSEASCLDEQQRVGRFRMSFLERERRRLVGERERLFRDPGLGLFSSKPGEFVLSEASEIRDDAIEYFTCNRIP
jgi:hypothetical protein